MNQYKIEVRQQIYTEELKNLMYDNFSNIVHDLYNSSPEASKWAIRSYYSGGVCYFDFSVIPELYVEKVKTYLLMNFAKKYAIEHVRTIFSAISRFLVSEKDDETIVDELVTDNIKYSTIKAFVIFTNDSDLKLFFENLTVRHKWIRGKFREIPEFESLIEYDYIISDFYNSASDDELLFYFPVIFWWEFANIIPMRRSELLLIKKDCVYQDGDKYFISIPTLKKRDGIIEIPYSPLNITKEVYDLIRYYQDATMEEEREYLFSCKIYKEVMESTLEDSQRFSTSQFRRTLKKFLLEIVQGRYGYSFIEKREIKEADGEIERILIGDLRHIAFYSALMQGLDPLTIQRLARHTSIYSQDAYYSNLKPYCKSKANVMAKRIKQKMLNEASFPDLDNHNPFRTRDSLISKLKQKVQGDSNPNMRDMGAVYCSSENFPYDCPFDTECVLCPKHIPKNDEDLELFETNEAIHRRELKELDETVDVIRAIRKERFFNASENQMAVKRLDCVINRLAMVTARLEEPNGKEENR